MQHSAFWWDRIFTDQSNASAGYVVVVAWSVDEAFTSSRGSTTDSLSALVSLLSSRNSNNNTNNTPARRHLHLDHRSEYNDHHLQGQLQGGLQPSGWPFLKQRLSLPQ